MQILVDADACPNVIKEIIFKAATRTSTKVILVANRPVRVPLTGFISSIQVPKGFDVADSKIVELAQAGDVVVTADIPLADLVVQKGARAIDPRGELYTEENIKDRLATRDLMEELRDGGMVTGGPKAFGPRERQTFANQLDRILAGGLGGFR